MRPNAFPRSRRLKRRRLLRPLFDRARPDVGRVRVGTVVLLFRTVEREETGAAHGEQGGRPPILLAFDASAGAALGIDFGHTHLRVAVADLSSNILAERAVPLDTDHAAQEGLDVALALVEEILADPEEKDAP